MTMIARAGFDNVMGRVPATFGGWLRGAGGYLVPILAKTDFSYDGRVNTNQDAPVAVGVDSSAWVSAVLVVRLHAKNSWATSAQVQVLVDNVMIVPEEPDVVFASASPIATVSFVQGSDNAPALKLAVLSAPIGPMLRVTVRWVQGTTAATATQTVSLGIDLVGRPA
ncbi:MAG: hypothetical protein IPM79_08180 [Polyangiaceae bacterium]|nr:hypothetical protein [Polyangiaceae bacterium]